MVAVFLLAGLPIYRLTRPAAAAAAAGPGPAAPAGDRPGVKAVPVDVAAVFAPAPADFEIKNLDRTVLAGRGPQARFATRWNANVPPEGVDLVIQAHWPVSSAGGAPAAAAAPGANPAAVRVTVRCAAGRPVERSFWAAADGALSEVFTVPGDPAATAP